MEAAVAADPTVVEAAAAVSRFFPSRESERAVAPGVYGIPGSNRSLNLEELCSRSADPNR